jgi:RHS repeat-associated protein
MISSHRTPRGVSSKPGAAIGSAGCAVEADLDRNGVINQLDYDISIADDGKSSSGGVGEAGLFSRGVRNSVGYCGYIYNEDSGLYTVRFRTYSPTLGRWLERDPAGYVDGMGLYEYVRGGPIAAVDPWGLQAGSLFAPPHGNQIYPKDHPRPALPDRWGTRKPFDPTTVNPGHRLIDPPPVPSPSDFMPGCQDCDRVPIWDCTAPLRGRWYWEHFCSVWRCIRGLGLSCIGWDPNHAVICLDGPWRNCISPCKKRGMISPWPASTLAVGHGDCVKRMVCPSERQRLKNQVGQEHGFNFFWGNCHQWRTSQRWHAW